MIPQLRPLGEAPPPPLPTPARERTKGFAVQAFTWLGTRIVTRLIIVGVIAVIGLVGRYLTGSDPLTEPAPINNDGNRTVTQRPASAPPTPNVPQTAPGVFGSTGYRA